MPAARTLQRRPGAPRPAAAPAAPAAKVPARPSTHLRDAALFAVAGVAGFGTASLVGYPGLELPSLLVGVGGGAVLAVTGQRAKRRRDLEDKVLEALAPLLGVRHLDRRIVKTTKWTNRWPGLPARVRIHYAPGAPDNDPMWKSEILAVLNSRLLARYEVARHEPRRCTIWLALVTKDQHGAGGRRAPSAHCQPSGRGEAGRLRLPQPDREGDLDDDAGSLASGLGPGR